MEWIDIEKQKPQQQKRVLVICEKPKYRGGTIKLQTIAEYVPSMTIPEEDYMDEQYWGNGDYDEEKDQYFTPEGFYEWQIEAEMMWRLSDKVTHWMPLPDPPK